MKDLFTAVLGPAGSGKSYRLKQLLDNDPTYGLKTSSSGISAVNIGATTLHSTLGYFNTEELLYKVADGSLYKILAKIRLKYRRLIIDEISMLPGQQLDLIMHVVQQLNQKYPDQPLGVEVVGDPGQLAPVSKDGEVTVSFLQSKYWPLFSVTQLTDIKRQDNLEFIRALMLVRAGRAAEAADWFAERIGFNKDLDRDFVGTTFLSTNRDVDAYNAQALKKISSVEKGYKKTVQGKTKGEWNNIPQEVILKPGCKALVLVNNIPEYANGDLVIVRELFRDNVLVEVLRTGKEHMISYAKLTNVEPGTTKEIGSLEFLPLRLADASTIHKSQGLTLDSAQVRVTDSFLRQLSGGLYVALSRVKTPQGLRLVGTKDAFIRGCFLAPTYRPYVKLPSNMELEDLPLAA